MSNHLSPPAEYVICCSQLHKHHKVKFRQHILKNTKSHQHMVSAGPTSARAELLLDVAGLSACANLSVRLRIVSLDKWKWQALSWLLYVSCGLLSCLQMISALLPHSTMLWVMFFFFFFFFVCMCHLVPLDSSRCLWLLPWKCGS